MRVLPNSHNRLFIGFKPINFKREKNSIPFFQSCFSLNIPLN
jgi:hypothetical protein